MQRPLSDGLPLTGRLRLTKTLHTARVPAPLTPLSVAEWLEGSGIKDRNLLERAENEYEHLKWVLEEEVPEDVNAPCSLWWTLQIQPQQQVFSANKKNQFDDQYVARLHILRALQSLHKYGIQPETRRIRAEQNIDFAEDQAMPTGPHLSESLRRFLEKLDSRLAVRYLRVLSNYFRYWEDLDETVIFFIEQTGVKLQAWERLQLLKAVKELKNEPSEPQNA